ncbi:cyclophilin-like fold protein [Oceanicella sp. SM1341]|uniref:cyclophilin-like fold protein n=1 Tax=Oceanicella sp. SM1341 TaxID=1548889 RepID=UPI000E479D03|nr:cyclophilin-like fold protein [Oceanicella sp. SM1341]
MTSITLTVGGETARATLADSAAARDFAALLPLELTLSDYHGIEKVADLPRRLDTSGAPRSHRPVTGEITYYAPWGNLAIFRKPFSDSAGLVLLGALEGPAAALLAEGRFPVRIEIAG